MLKLVNKIILTKKLSMFNKIHNEVYKKMCKIDKKKFK